MSKLVSRWLLGTALLCFGMLAAAQDKLDKPQLDQLMAPVALYPDALLSQVLMAATYPDDVKSAAEWSKGNQSLSGDPAVKAVDGQPWDPSVKSLAAFPSVLDMMGREPRWVQSAGDAFLDQPEDVMDAVQRLRRQAQDAGALKSNEQQTVTVQQQGPAQVVVIEPAQPEVVYVPQYNPAVVYGAWPYPAYPPYYYPPPVGSYFATALIGGIGFGLGVAAVNSLWGGFNWGGNNVNINVNRYNNVNVNNRLNANQTNFRHNAERRGSTPYRGNASRQQFDGQRQAGAANRGGAGGGLSDRDAARNRAAGSFEQRTGQGIPGHDGRGGAAAGGRDRAGQGGAGDRGQAGGAGDRRGDGAGGGDRRGQGAGGGDRAGQGGAGRDNAAARQRQDHNAAVDRSRSAGKDSALRDAGNGARVNQQSQRPSAQRQGGGGAAHQPAARPSGGGAHQPAARPSGGGGGARAGGGGGGGGARGGGGGGGGGGGRGGGGGGGGGGGRGR